MATMATAAWVESKTLGDGPTTDIPSGTVCAVKKVGGLALQVNELNRIAVITWIRCRGWNSGIARGGVAIADPRKPLDPPKVASVGDWIVAVAGSLLIVPDTAFVTMFSVPGRY